MVVSGVNGRVSEGNTGRVKVSVHTHLAIVEKSSFFHTFWRTLEGPNFANNS